MFKVIVYICSVGIGRIGIYCIIDYMFWWIMEGDLEVVDIGNMVWNFRL